MLNLVQYALFLVIFLNTELEGETLNIVKLRRLDSKSDLYEMKSKSVHWKICILHQNPSDANPICLPNNASADSKNLV